MSRATLRRRAFLASLGAGAAAAALPWWLRAPRASAGPKTIPRRIIFFFTGGSMRGRWEPVAPAGLPAPTEDQFELGELHQPLADFKSELLILDGLDMISADLDTSPAAEPHANGATHALAATSRAGPVAPGGISIDQLIAAKINATPQTWLRSLEVVASGAGTSYNNASAYGYGQPAPQLWDPRAVYARLYPAADDYPQSRSVLAFVEGEAKALRGKLGGEDRQRLDQHLDTLSDLEVRLGIGQANTAPRPPASMLDPLKGLAFGPDGSPDVQAARYSLTTDLHLRLVTAALAADLTRVVTLSLHPPPDATVGYSPGAWGTADLHGLQHIVAGPPGGAALQDPAAIAMVKEIHLEQAAQLAKLLGALQAVKEPDGSTLLDHTAVLWCGEIAEAEHDLHQLPWVIAGRCGGRFATGRYLRYPKGEDGKGRPHNDLFVSLANAMDVAIDTFGNPECCTGPLEGLTG